MRPAPPAKPHRIPSDTLGHAPRCQVITRKTSRSPLHDTLLTALGGSWQLHVLSQSDGLHARERIREVQTSSALFSRCTLSPPRAHLSIRGCPAHAHVLSQSSQNRCGDLAPQPCIQPPSQRGAGMRRLPRRGASDGSKSRLPPFAPAELASAFQIESLMQATGARARQALETRKRWMGTLVGPAGLVKQSGGASGWRVARKCRGCGLVRASRSVAVMCASHVRAGFFTSACVGPDAHARPFPLPVFLQVFGGRLLVFRSLPNCFDPSFQEIKMLLSKISGDGLPPPATPALAIPSIFTPFFYGALDRTPRTCCQCFFFSSRRCDSCLRAIGERQHNRGWPKKYGLLAVVSCVGVLRLFARRRSRGAKVKHQSSVSANQDISVTPLSSVCYGKSFAGRTQEKPIGPPP